MQMLRAWVVVGLIGIWIGTMARAQRPAPGDYVVAYGGQQGGIAAISTAGVFTSLLPPALPLRPFDVTMDRDNGKMLVVSFSGRGDAVVRLWPNGYAERVNARKQIGRADGIDLDQDGRFVVSTASGFMKVYSDPSSDYLQPLGPAIRDVNDLKVDLDTGDYLFAVTPITAPQRGYVLRVDRQTLAGSTLLGAVGDVQAIEVDPRTGNYVVLSRTYPQVRVFDRTLRRVSTITTVDGFTPVDLEIDHDTGLYHIADAGFSTSVSGRVRTVTPSGVVVRSFAFGQRAGSPFFEGLTIYGSRKVFVAPVEPLRRGFSFVPIDVSFPALGAGGFYQILLSLRGRRPGVAFPGNRRLNLAPDAFTLQLATFGDLPGVTTKFRGTLDSTARARGVVNLSPAVPSGLRVYVNAIALGGNRIGLGNTGVFLTP